MIHPALLLARLREGSDDAELLAWLQDGFARWTSGNGAVTLYAALGLPPSPAAVRREERDLWLRGAAEKLAGSPWGKAERLAIEIRRLGSAWGTLTVPPSSATPVQACLFFALRTGATLPRTARRLHTIITEAHLENASEKVVKARAA